MTSVSQQSHRESGVPLLNRLRRRDTVFLAAVGCSAAVAVAARAGVEDDPRRVVRATSHGVTVRALPGLVSLRQPDGSFVVSGRRAPPSPEALKPRLPVHPGVTLRVETKVEAQQLRFWLATAEDDRLVAQRLAKPAAGDGRRWLMELPVRRSPKADRLVIGMDYADESGAAGYIGLRVHRHKRKATR